MDQLALLFVLLLGAVVSVPLGDRLGLPAPVLMTLLGIVLAVLDFVPNVDIPPDLILPLLLPPLLYAAVRRTSWRQFAANMRPIFLLAVALVFVTTVCRGRRRPRDRAGAADRRRRRARRAGRAARPGRRDRRGRPARAAPPAGLHPGGRGAVQRRHGDRALPRGDRRRGERRRSRRGGPRLDLVLSARGRGGGRASRSAGAPTSCWTLLGDATLQIGLTLLVPYASYVLAEELHGSGVLAVLTTALFLAEYATDADDVHGPAGRPHLLGDRRHPRHGRRVRADRPGTAQRDPARRPGGWGEMLGWARGDRGAWSSCVRLLWLLPATWLAKRLHARRDHDEDIPMSWRETVVMWWSGMRGVASVALALAIPLKTDDGRPSPTGTRSSSSRSA